MARLVSYNPNRSSRWAIASVTFGALTLSSFACHAKPKAPVAFTCKLASGAEFLDFTYIYDGVSNDNKLFDITVLGSAGVTTGYGIGSNNSFIFMETPEAGSAVTTINIMGPKFNAVHSRNMVVNGKSVVSMYVGQCDLK